ncbi:MAG: hypothetical protein HYY18_18935 [Planctomycetes bacterium]|nr:hypothetical protein [Planctomycetota bacterium]
MRRLSALAVAVLLAGVLVWRMRREEDPSADGASSASLPAPETPKPLETTGSGPTEAGNGGDGSVPEREPTPVADRKTGLPAALAWLLRSRNADGSWGGEAEMFEGAMYTKHSATSLALLALFGAGYTHLSREESEGTVVGKAIKEALQWLAANKPETPFDAALVSLAWGEAWGMTNSALFKEHVEGGLKTLLELQTPDGSWGGDARTSSWAAMALKSAEISGLEVPKEARDAASAWFAARLEADPRAEDAVAWVLLATDRTGAAADRAKAALGARPPNWSQQDFGYWYHGSMAMFQLDGPSGPLFSRWGEGLKATLGGFQDARVGWAGEGRGTADVVKNSMGQLTLEVFYRYASVFGAKK